MRVSFLKYRLFLVSFLLSQASPLVIDASSAMEDVGPPLAEELPARPCAPRLISLQQALNLFEDPQTVKGTKNWIRAGRVFSQLRQAGAVVPIAYLKYMDLDPLDSFEKNPVLGLQLSEAFFQASMVYRGYRSATTRNEKSKYIQELGVLCFKEGNGNAHALALLHDIQDKNKDAKVLETLRQHANLKKKSFLRKARKIDELDKYFSSPYTGLLQFWDYLDWGNLTRYFEKHKEDENAVDAMLKFKEYYYCTDPKFNKNIGQSALKVCRKYTNQLFWSHFAIENGENAACPFLGGFFYLSKIYDFKSTAGYYFSQLKSISREENKEKLFDLLESFAQEIYANNRSDVRYLAHLRKAVALGDECQLYNIAAFLCEHGNNEEARKYYKLAIDKGFHRANLAYASMCEEGRGGEIDLKEARKYCKIAIQLKVSGAHEQYLSLPCDDLEEKEEVLAYCEEYCRKSAVLGDYSRYYDIAAFLYKVRKYEEARKYYKIAIENGIDRANLAYSSMCAKGQGGEIDLKEAHKYCKIAIQLNVPGAHEHYLSLACDDLEEKKEVLAYCKEKVDKDKDAESQYIYAMKCIDIVEGQPIDLIEAKKYLELSAKKNHFKAIFELAKILYKEGKFSRVFGLYKRLADKGSAEALFLCGLMHEIGAGCDKNLEKAYTYCMEAAWRGKKDALMKCIEIQRCIEIQEAINKQKEQLALMQAQEETQELNKPLMPEESSVVEETKELIQEENLEEGIEIDFPQLEEKAESSSDDETEEVITPTSVPAPLPEAEEKSSAPAQCTPTISLTEEMNRVTEVEKLNQEHARTIAELRAKKQAQKEAAKQTRHVLEVKRKDYNRSLRSSLDDAIEGPAPIQLSQVEYETLEFVKTIFGEGSKRINAFSNIEAKQAFADLGCIVEDGNGENSTLLSFDLKDGSGGIIKFKWHNPHGHGDENLYNAVKPYMKRFLISINKTPQTLRVR